MFDTLLSVGASLLGGAMGADSAEDAANAQAQSSDRAIQAQTAASNKAIKEQKRQFDLSRGDLAPYRNVGGQALMRVSDLLGLPSGPVAGTSGTMGASGVGGDWKSALKEGYADVFAENPGFNQAVLPSIYFTIDQANDVDQVLAYGQQTGVRAPDNLNEVMVMKQQASQPAPQAAQSPAVQAAQSQPSQQFGALNKQFTVGDFYKDPVVELGMKYGLELGTKGIDQTFGASGMRKSGDRLKALTQFGTDYAGTQAAGSRDRFYNDQDRIFNRLSGVAGTGQAATTTSAGLGANAAQNIGNIGMTAAGNIGNTMTAAGNARGAASIAKGNAWGGAFQNIGNWWNGQRTLDKILTNGGGIGGGMPSNGSWQNNYIGGVWQ